MMAHFFFHDKYIALLPSICVMRGWVEIDWLFFCFDIMFD